MLMKSPVNVTHTFVLLACITETVQIIWIVSEQRTQADPCDDARGRLQQEMPRRRAAETDGESVCTVA